MKTLTYQKGEDPKVVNLFATKTEILGHKLFVEKLKKEYRFYCDNSFIFCVPKDWVKGSNLDAAIKILTDKIAKNNYPAETFNVYLKSCKI